MAIVMSLVSASVLEATVGISVKTIIATVKTTVRV